MEHHELLENYLATGEGLEELTVLIHSLNYDEVLEILESSLDDYKPIIFDVLDEYVALKCFKVLPEKTRQLLIKRLNHEKAARLLNSLPDDDLAQFMEGLPSRVVNEWLKLLSNRVIGEMLCRCWDIPNTR